MDVAVNDDRVRPGGERTKFGKHCRDVPRRAPGPTDGVGSFIHVGIKSRGEDPEEPPRRAICGGHPGNVNGENGHDNQSFRDCLGVAIRHSQGARDVIARAAWKYT